MKGPVLEGPGGVMMGFVTADVVRDGLTLFCLIRPCPKCRGTTYRPIWRLMHN